MSLPVVLRRKAQAEFDEALDWYEQQPGHLEIPGLTLRRGGPTRSASSLRDASRREPS
ncbi:MAG: hypothetical protein JO034_12925 [Singulisphaera sp.]|nr:hypothetical protein [Singulisphaera sp.]